MMSEDSVQMRRAMKRFLVVGLVLVWFSQAGHAARYSADENDALIRQDQVFLDLFQIPGFVVDANQQGYRYLAQAIDFLTHNDAASADNVLNEAKNAFFKSYQESPNVIAANGLVKAALLQKNYTEARKWLNHSLEINPDNMETLFLHARLLMSQQDYKAAESILKDIVKTHDNYKPAFLALAEIASRRKQLSSVEKYLKSVLSLDPTIPVIYTNLATLYNFENKPDKAQVILQQGYQAMGDDATKSIFLATVLVKYNVKAGKPDQALVLARSVFERFPGSSQALNLYLDALIANGKQDQAETLLRDRIKQNPADVNLKRKLVLLFQGDEARQADVIALFKSIVSENDKNATDYVSFFKYLIKTKHYDEAQQVIKDVRKAFPDSNIADVLQAEWFLAKNEIKKSAESYISAYRKAPNNNLLVKVVQALNVSKQKDRAIKLLKNEIEKQQSVAARVLLAGMYLADNHIAEAEAEYRAVLSINPNHYIALNDLAWLLGKKNRVKEALPLAEKAYSIAPGNGEVVDTYVELLKKLGQNDKAEKVALDYQRFTNQ